MINCLICNTSDKVSFLSDYLLEIKEDYEFFKDSKIYRCSDCDFAFVSPMPSEKKLNEFYEKVYRAEGRPPYFVSENYEDQKKHYLDDKNLSYLLYITTLIDIRKIKNLYDFGCGVGDLGFALKKKFPHLELYCTEHDNHCEKILLDRGYTNFQNIENIDQTFDLITTTHSLEHLLDINLIFKKFKELLKPSGLIFFEVPNFSEEYWKGRPYDGPHLLFFTKKSFDKLIKIHGFEFVNFSYSAYSFSKDHQYQRESQNTYYMDQKSLISNNKLKRFFKKFIPKKIVRLRQDYIQTKNIRNDDRMDWYANNTGDNCYMRGVLRKI
jgi:2-polyprenyl-3-methyl-5-hydroxy-6-metoxy-1,4-benzoquinol methylase|tara:strand:+ start:930 stop:1901 length:972 start_codon:yes stop_codon:yes gene_type:complete